MFRFFIVICKTVTMKQSFAMKVLFLSFALQDIVGYNGRTGLVTRNELLLKVNIPNNKEND